jgi:hypothetical protein
MNCVYIGEQVKGKALIWMCKTCKWVSVSNQTPHEMQFCKCPVNPTYVDHEVGLLRYGGKDLKTFKPLMMINLDTCRKERLPRGLRQA